MATMTEAVDNRIFSFVILITMQKYEKKTNRPNFNYFLFPKGLEYVFLQG